MLEAENEGHRSMTPDWGTLEIALFLLVLYSSTLGLVLGWCGWSVVKHGWRKGGLRRASYILFALFLATRVCWCIVLMAEAMGVAPLASDSEISTSVALGPTSRLLMAPVARLFDCLAYFLHFAVLSLLVCGWAESRYMMSETRSMQPVNMRPSGLLHHYRPTYFAINATFAGLMTVGLLPLVCAPQGQGWIGAGEKLDLFLTAGFSLMLAVASMVAGLSVACKMVAIISIEPSLRSYAHAKARKVTFAASVFGISALSRSCILIHVALAATGAYDPNNTDESTAEDGIPVTVESTAAKGNPVPARPSNGTESAASATRSFSASSADDDNRHFATPALVSLYYKLPPPSPVLIHPSAYHADPLLSPHVFLSMGVALPDLLPTVIALLVLRRRSRFWLCFGRRSSREGSVLLWSPVDRAPLRGGSGSEFEVPGWPVGGL